MWRKLQITMMAACEGPVAPESGTVKFTRGSSKSERAFRHHEKHQMDSLLLPASREEAWL